MSITCSDGYFTSEASYNAFMKKKAKAQADADARATAQAEGRNGIRSRNATTHGLFARDVVLPHLGEDPAGYDALFQELTAQISPANLLERHYTEKIAAASWRLRRLHRWQAQLFEDDSLTEDERLDKLDRVLRHETALHRQIDTAVKMLSREVPRLFEGRARETALSLVQATERDCAQSQDTDWDVARTAREKRTFPPLPADFDYATLDNTPASHAGNCQNEPAPLTPPDPTPPELGAGGRSPLHPLPITGDTKARELSGDRKGGPCSTTKIAKTNSTPPPSQSSHFGRTSRSEE